MMLASEQTSLMQLFKETAEAKKREERRIDADIIVAEERELSQRREEAKREAMQDAIVQAAERIADFRDQLDRYDTATVQALMENERLIEEARKRQDDLLAKTYTLPDGRKAFKTEDGMHVVDQGGQEIEGVDPHSLPDTGTRWEDYQSAHDRGEELQKQRDELLKFQDKLDHTRDQVDHDGAAADLDALDADLKAAMPDAVRNQLGNDDSKPEAVHRIAPAPIQFNAGLALN